MSDTTTCPTLGPRNRSLALLLISILGLFLELLLIRWIGTEVNIFAYLQNTVLVVCFLGLGMGCLTCRKPISLLPIAVPLVIFALLLAIPLTRDGLRNISLLLSSAGDLVVWNEVLFDRTWKTIVAVGLGLLMTLALMVLILEAFIPIGRVLGRLLDDHPRPIWAYSVNVIGSLIGIWLFVLMCVWYQPPVIWFTVVVALLLCFVRIQQTRRALLVALLPVLLVAAWFAGSHTDSVALLWSPYQKIELKRVSDVESFEYNVFVNNYGFCSVARPTTPEQWDDSRIWYEIPPMVHPNPRRHLIVGSGSGNDVAGALRQNVEHITAVEIDPAIIALGQAYNPAQPYASERVQVVNDDARSYFAKARERFDLITIALLDSHTTVSMTNARLDHYVYTRESITAARGLLNDGGIMVLTFFARRPFIADRMNTMLTEVFEEPPIAFHMPMQENETGVTFIVGDLDAARRQIAGNEPLGRLIAKWRQQYPLELAGTAPVTTDDWPYLYLRGPQIPPMYWMLGVMIGALVVYSRRRLQLHRLGVAWQRSQWHFFFLGAAFLLLEVQNISKAAVVLGSTWDVNAVIISGILVMILLANALAARYPQMSIRWVYTGLIASCVALYFVDLARFGFMPYVTKALVVGALTTVPMLFSGIIFVRSLAGVPDKAQALGANLLGALVGGLLQSVTFLIGVKALLLIVAAAYLAAAVTDPRRQGQRADEPAVSLA